MQTPKLAQPEGGLAFKPKKKKDNLDRTSGWYRTHSHRKLSGSKRNKKWNLGLIVPVSTYDEEVRVRLGKSQLGERKCWPPSHLEIGVAIATFFPDGVERAWLPMQTEIMKGECPDADAKTGAAE